MERLRISGALSAELVKDASDFAITSFLLDEARIKGGKYTNGCYSGDVSIVMEYEIIDGMYNRKGTLMAEATYNRGKTIIIKKKLSYD